MSEISSASCSGINSGIKTPTVFNTETQNIESKYTELKNIEARKISDLSSVMLDKFSTVLFFEGVDFNNTELNNDCVQAMAKFLKV